MSNTEKTIGKIFLMPVPLAFDGQWAQSVPPHQLEQYRNLDYFVVERAKTARAFLGQLKHPKPIAQLNLVELNEHSPIGVVEQLLKPVLEGQNCGLMSEAGCPAVADPGADLVAAAHKKNIEVVPGIGPSSILMALMASGLNGQRFAFEGYLPADKAQRDQALKDLEKRSLQLKQTQLWIETPYRSQAIFQAACLMLKPSTRLTVACDISLSSELIKTKTIEQWVAKPIDIQKRLTVFGMLG
jgi:16S rRNA (cytidine1402-2'-O)-methyltransferase